MYNILNVRYWIFSYQKENILQSHEITSEIPQRNNMSRMITWKVHQNQIEYLAALIKSNKRRINGEITFNEVFQD